MLRYDRELETIVDQDTGDVLKAEQWHWQAEGPRAYWIEDSEGQRIFSFRLERFASDPSGLHGGAATLVEIKLHEAIEHSQFYPKTMNLFFGESHDQIDKIIEYFRDGVRGKNPEPKLFVTDCRRKRN